MSGIEYNNDKYYNLTIQKLIMLLLLILSQVYYSGAETKTLLNLDYIYGGPILCNTHGLEIDLNLTSSNGHVSFYIYEAENHSCKPKTMFWIEHYGAFHVREVLSFNDKLNGIVKCNDYCYMIMNHNFIMSTTVTFTIKSRCIPLILYIIESIGIINVLSFIILTISVKIYRYFENDLATIINNIYY
jgi:hypothetical protein